MIAVATVATASVASVSRMGHAVVSESASNRRWQGSCSGHAQVHEQQHDRHRDRKDLQCVRARPAVPVGDRDDREEERGGEHQSDRDQSGAAVDLLRRPDDQREPEDQQQVADHAARERSANDLDQGVVDRKERDDQFGALPKVALRKPPIPGPVCLARARSPPRSTRRVGSATMRRARTG
jgi:hypothetical protein